MKKFWAGILAVALVLSIAHHIADAANFSTWKCSQCGVERRMAGEHQPPANGCKVAGKHIWFRVK